MIVDCEALQCLCTSIDEPKTMHLGTVELEFRNSGVGDAFGSSRRLSFETTVEIILAINQVVIWDWYSSWSIGGRSLL